MTGRFSFWFAALAALWLSVAASQAWAQSEVWTVAKTSGEAWIGSAGQPASLSQQMQLRPGDSIRTGRNGRVLLVRGQETILLSPNSAISLPEAGRAGMSTVIQQAGSILLDVEKRNVQHFEVETPYLAAVVKGTRFQVSITGSTAKVDVVRGQVQVSDFRSGDYALVNPQQFARSSFGSANGLRLGGAGRLDPVMHGAPQAPRVAPLRVPAGGLRPGANAVPLRSAQPTTSASATGNQPAVQRTASGGTRIVAPIGELKLDIGKVTKGMARSESGGKGSGKDWAANLQPGNGGNTPKTENSGAAVSAPSDTGGTVSATATRSGNVASAPLTGGVVVSNAALAVTGTADGGGLGAGVGPGLGNSVGSAGLGNGVGLGQSNSNSSGNSGQGSGNKGSNSSSGNGGGNGNGILGLIGQVADDLGLGGLVDNRGRGNAYGNNGGNGIGKALGLGKKK